jgi:hypothetical protein
VVGARWFYENAEPGARRYCFSKLLIRVNLAKIIPLLLETRFEQIAFLAEGKKWQKQSADVMMR